MTARNRCRARLDARTLRDATVKSPPPLPSPGLLDSPVYLLAVLFSARKSKDRPLEELTRQRLNSLGVRIIFGDDLPAPNKTKGGACG